MWHSLQKSARDFQLLIFSTFLVFTPGQKEKVSFSLFASISLEKRQVALIRQDLFRKHWMPSGSSRGAGEFFPNFANYDKFRSRKLACLPETAFALHSNGNNV